MIVTLFTPGIDLNAKLCALHPTQIEVIGATLAKPPGDLHASLCALFPTQSEVISAAIAKSPGDPTPMLHAWIMSGVVKSVVSQH